MGPGAGCSLAGRLAEAAAEACRTRTRPGPIAQPTDLTPRLTPGATPRPPRSVPAPAPIPRALVDAWTLLQPAEHDALLALVLSLVRPRLAPPRVLRIRRDVYPLMRTVRAALVDASRRSRLDSKGIPPCV
jgi:hypothetical protein